MSRTRRFIGGAGFGYANQFIVTVTGLWLTPFLLSHLGQHDYGLWLVGTQTLAYLMLMDFGVVALLPRETAFAAGRSRETGAQGGLSLLVGQTARLVLWQTPLVAVAAFAFWMLLPARWELLRQPLSVVLLTVVLMFPLRIFQAVLLGLQDFEFLGKSHTFIWLVSTALTILLVFAGFGLYALAIGWAVTQILGVPIMLYRLRSRFMEALPRTLPRLPRAEARKKLVNGFWVSINQIAVVLLAGTDVLVIGKLLGPAAVVPYACTVKLISVLSNQPQMLMQLAIPALSELRAGSDRKHISRVCVALSQAMLLLSGAVVCVVLVVNRGFVGWWVGSDQFGGFVLSLLTLLLMLLRHLNLTIGIILYTFGGERKLAVVGLLDGIVTLICSVILTNWLGVVGVPLGSIVGVCLVGLPCNLLGLKASGALPVMELLRSLSPWLWRFGFLLVIEGLLSQQFVPNTFLRLAAASLLAAGVYALIMLPLAWREPLGVYVRPRLSPIWIRFSRAFQRSVI